MSLTKPCVSCFVYIVTGSKPNYDLSYSVSVQQSRLNIWLSTLFYRLWIDYLPVKMWACALCLYKGECNAIFFLLFGRQVHKKESKLEIMTNVGKSQMQLRIMHIFIWIKTNDLLIFNKYVWLIVKHMQGIKFHVNNSFVYASFTQCLLCTNDY